MKLRTKLEEKTQQIFNMIGSHLWNKANGFPSYTFEQFQRLWELHNAYWEAIWSNHKQKK